MVFKSTIIFCQLMLLAFFLSAQSPFGASKVGFNKNLFYFDLNGGFSTPSLVFDNNQFAGLKSDRFFDQTFGMGLRIQFKPKMSFSTHLSYRELGGKFNDYHQFCLQANYLNLFSPLEYDIQLTAKPRSHLPNIMLYAGPYFAYNLGGTINSEQIELLLTSNEMAQLDYGVEGGMGIRVPTYSFTGKSYITLKASFFRGLANNFPVGSTHELAQKEQLMIADAGSRFNQGLRLTVSYELSLNKKKMTTFTAGGDGKKTYKRILVK
jgi:hypothetical protein